MRQLEAEGFDVSDGPEASEGVVRILADLIAHDAEVMENAVKAAGNCGARIESKK